jgi:hypothetical protein
MTQKPPLIYCNAEGVGTLEISKVMGETQLSIRGKMNNLRLFVVDAAAVP